MKRLSLIICLISLFSCSSISFQSSQKVSVTLNERDFQNNEVTILVSKPFYVWGLVPSEHIVEVDKEFYNKGFESVSDLKIKEVKKIEKALWMMFTFGMYYPQSFELYAKTN